MKRVWIAVALIILSGFLCAFERIQVDKTCNQLISMLEQAQEYEQADEKELRDKKIDEIQEYWNKNNNLIYVFSEHGGLDELAKNIRSLRQAHNMKSALAETKTLVIVFYENEKLTLANIF